jgi:hypothetical protein
MVRLVALLCVLPLAGVARGESPGGPGPGPGAEAEPKIRVIRLAVPPGGRDERALRYALLPGPLDLTPGNAAPLWVRAGRSFREVKRKLTETEDRWRSPIETPLEKLPRDKLRELLKDYAAPLRLAEQAARKERCDWELSPLTIQTLSDNLPLDEMQDCRFIATLLGLQFRLYLAERDFDRTIHTIQTGLALARHVGEADLLIQNLVGIAIAAIMFGHLEEFVQQPGAPDLYWPLTTLPRPFIDIRRSLRYELDTVYRSFPAMRQLSRASDQPLPAGEIEAMMRQLVEFAGQVGGTPLPAWQNKLALSAVLLKVYPDARNYLRSRGLTEEQVNALSTLQAVGTYYLQRYDWWCDEMLKWLSVPPWQSRDRLQQLEKDLARDMRDRANPLLLIFPAILKVQEATVRLERSIAGLRCAEGLRLYAAAHDGKGPAKLEDVTAVPLPLDPATGKSMDAWYKVRDGVGVLEVPALTPMPAWMGRRYELSVK